MDASMFARLAERFEGPPATDRRAFLKLAVGAGAGLVIGARLPAYAGGGAPAAGPQTEAFTPFVRITPDNKVIVLSKHLDKGQGVATGLATLVAEELDADWAQVVAEFSPADPVIYKNNMFGVQGTGGSSSINNSFEQYRQAGAAARAMLVAAAAQQWKVGAETIKVDKGVVSAAGQRATFGELAAAAARLPVPEKVTLKDPSAFVYIGKGVPRIETKQKVAGAPLFTQDVHLPGMLVAVVAHSPRFGGQVKSVDSTAAKAVPGVVDVVELPHGVAVLAKSTWPAIKARDALKVTWDDSKAEKRGTAELLADFRKLAAGEGLRARGDGNAAEALKNAAKVVEAEYVFPYLAHATMEPMNAIVQFKDGKATIWTGSQLQTVDQMVTAGVLGIRPEDVAINTLWAGGSFGRRAVPDSDYVREAAMIAKAWGKPDPIKLVWTREDDTRAGRYRPLVLHQVKAGLDAAGKLVAWQHVVVGQSIMANSPFAAQMAKTGIDPTLVEGAGDTRYEIPNFEYRVHQPEAGVPVLWWRSVGHTHTAYVVETMMDELAQAAGKDPVAFRLALLEKQPRLQGVLKLAAEKAGWGKPLGEGRFRGIAVHESFYSYVAQVAEIVLTSDGAPQVKKVCAAIDCGLAVNPDNVRAQIEGGIGYGLSGILTGAVTLKDGVVVEGNFDTYRVLRMGDMPEVEVHIVPSPEKPTGVGEPGVPPIGPAVANAYAAATGKRVRELPLLRPAGANWTGAS
jgi:isoquinoline 1-oxidoreductase beta subunit